jgi:very-short-patch-repair endonuclease
MPRWFIRYDRQPRASRKFKVYTNPEWNDPFWFILGASSIEKMVMAELFRRGVYFQHRVQSNTLGGFVDPTWEADFLLPQYQIWIEVQGSYFHSLPGQIEADAYRFAAIEMAGWRPIFLWEFDIRTRLHDILDEIPELYMVNALQQQQAAALYGVTSGLSFYEGGVIDQLAGLRQALSNRTKPPQYRSRRATRRRPK